MSFFDSWITPLLHFSEENLNGIVVFSEKYSSLIVSCSLNKKIFPIMLNQKKNSVKFTAGISKINDLNISNKICIFDTPTAYYSIHKKILMRKYFSLIIEPQQLLEFPERKLNEIMASPEKYCYLIAKPKKGNCWTDYNKFNHEFNKIIVSCSWQK